MGLSRQDALAAWMTFFAAEVVNGRVPDEPRFFAALVLVAEAAALRDQATLALAHEGCRSLRENLPEHPSRALWVGRRWTVETLAWLGGEGRAEHGER
jgi:hypothetical protein